MLAAPAVALPRGCPGPSGWLLHWTRQWRALLALLSLIGMNCTSGWPPRPSRRVRCYGGLVLVVRTAHCVVVILSMKDSYDRNKDNYAMLLCLCEIALKCVVTAAAQFVMLIHCKNVCRLTECVLLYSRSGSPTSDCGAMVFVGPAYASGLGMVLGLAVYLIASNADESLTEVSYVLGELTSAVPLLVFWIMQLLLTSLSVGFARDARRHVGGWQFLHDMVLQHNSAFGWCFLCCLAHGFMEAVICLYLGVSYFRRSLDNVEVVKPRLLFNPWFFTWGILQVTMFSGMCVLGQLLSDIHGRIFCDIQTARVSNSRFCRATKMELQSFAQQIQRQDNRPGMFGLLYYDLTTMKTGFATLVTYIIVLCQFEP
ncbi:Gustatory receptor 75 [Frankliniella occidentalis]|nr:Gustatory receptor 75 [Frankliniella occidentalis]